MIWYFRMNTPLVIFCRCRIPLSQYHTDTAFLHILVWYRYHGGGREGGQTGATGTGKLRIIYIIPLLEFDVQLIERLGGREGGSVRREVWCMYSMYVCMSVFVLVPINWTTFFFVNATIIAWYCSSYRDLGKKKKKSWILAMILVCNSGWV